ncbi:MAG: pantoate--beta-alanine ligase [Terriglobales bacterium]
MRILKTPDDMHAACAQLKREGRRIGFVPTMGALHEGHLSLVRAARKQCDVVAASIFVNPLQFGPTEDLEKYPRPFERDQELLVREGCDLLFAPDAKEMYPPGAATYVEVAGIGERLDGKSRPGHFRGVTTVVSKLFHIVEPDSAFFGQKDAAQVAILRRMVSDQSLPVRIVVCPIVRESDGLAMSSRNAYLSPAERKQALVLHRALMRVHAMADQGERNAAKLVAAGREVIAEEPGAKLDYFEAVNWDTLEPVMDIRGGALVAVAAWIGSTRLIDNVVLHGVGNAGVSR